MKELFDELLQRLKEIEQDISDRAARGDEDAQETLREFSAPGLLQQMIDLAEDTSAPRRESFAQTCLDQFRMVSFMLERYSGLNDSAALNRTVRMAWRNLNDAATKALKPTRQERAEMENRAEAARLEVARELEERIADQRRQLRDREVAQQLDQKRQRVAEHEAFARENVSRQTIKFVPLGLSENLSAEAMNRWIDYVFLPRADVNREWLHQFWKYATSARDKITHSFMFRGMVLLEMHIPPALRGEVYDSLDALNKYNAFTLNEHFRFDDVVSPYFDIEPDHEAYRSALRAREQNDLSSAELQDTTFGREDVLSVLVECFRYWDLNDIVWVVWSRETPSGPRFHVRVRHKNGMPAMMKGVSFAARCRHLKDEPRRYNNTPNVWAYMGWDLNVLENKLRIPISAKVFDLSRIAPRGVVEDKKIYTFDGLYIYEYRQWVQVTSARLGWAYTQSSIRAACALPWFEGRATIHQREKGRYDINSDWMHMASELSCLKLSDVSNLNADTFNVNWKPLKSLEDSLKDVTIENCEEKWQELAQQFVRINRNDEVFVLIASGRAKRGVTTEISKEYSFVRKTKQEFRRAFEDCAFEVRKTKLSFVDTALKYYKFNAWYNFYAAHTPLANASDAKQFTNSWRGPGITPNEALAYVRQNPDLSVKIVSHFLQLLKALVIGSPREPEVKNRRYSMWAFSALLHYVWKIFREPYARGKMNLIPVLSGFPGCGKGTLAYIIQGLVGEQECTTMTGDHMLNSLASQFNAPLFKLFVFFDECTRWNENVQSTLKSFATERSSLYNQKNEKAQNQELFSHLMIAYNKLEGIPGFDVGDRRFMCTEGIKRERSFYEFFNQNEGVISPSHGGLAAIAAYLYTIDGRQEFFKEAQTNLPIGKLKRTLMKQTTLFAESLHRYVDADSWLDIEGSWFPYIASSGEISTNTEKDAKDQHDFWGNCNDDAMSLLGANRGSTDYYQAWPPVIPLITVMKLIDPQMQPSAKKAMDRVRRELESYIATWSSYAACAFPEGDMRRNGSPLVPRETLHKQLGERLWRNERHVRECDAERLVATQIPGMVRCLNCKGGLPTTKFLHWNRINGVTNRRPDASADSYYLFLPKHGDAMKFLRNIMIEVTNIEKVYFPTNWTLNSFKTWVQCVHLDLGSQAFLNEPEDEESVYESLDATAEYTGETFMN